MTLEEFNRVDIRTGRPCLHWNNKKWQAFYKILRLKVTPIKNPEYRKMRCSSVRLAEGEEYQGETNYQSYCRYLNDVLTSIRLGGTEYCYYIYQIADLLKFEPNLKTRFCGGDELSPYIEVWL